MKIQNQCWRVSKIVFGALFFAMNMECHKFHFTIKNAKMEQTDIRWKEEGWKEMVKKK